MKYEKLGWFGGLCLLAGCAADGQSQTVAAPLALGTIFWTIAGLITMSMGLFMPQVNRMMGWPTAESRFNVPKFKRTAQLNGRISRAVLLLLGLGMVVNGVGPRLLPHSLSMIIAYVLLGLAFLGILLMIIVTIGNWRA